MDAPDELISTGKLAERVGCSISAIKKFERLGILPPALRVVGSDRRVYRSADVAVVRELVEKRLAARAKAA